MTEAQRLGECWAAALAKPSTLWQPATGWKPYEWTPLPAALDRLTGMAGREIAAFDLHEHLATGQIKSALRHLYEPTKSSSLLLLHSEFWRSLQFRRGFGGFIHPEGTVAGLPLGGGSWAFFVCIADLDRLYPVAASPPIAKQSMVMLAKELMRETFPQEEWRTMGPRKVRHACEGAAEKRKKKLPSPDSFARAMGRR
jgi:hypothetical protein